MSDLSDEYTKNFTAERKKEFNRRFRDDYDAAMSERSNIIRILMEMRELGLAKGGRIGLKEGLGSFETNDPEEAMKEIINRIINKKAIATIPISENMFLNLGPEVGEAELGGIMKILGGELGFGANKDKGIGFQFTKEFNKGGRVAYQDGTEYNEDSKEKLKDLVTQAVDKFDQITGVDQITGANFPGSFDKATGLPSDFRHQAASNLVAEALGKGKLGPIGYLSGGIGSFGLGSIKEIGDLVSGLMDPNTTAKDAFSQAYEDTISNFKGAFAPPGTTSEDLYAELMKDYQQPIRTGMFDPFKADLTSQIFMQRKKALEEARKKQKDSITTAPKIKRTTTKPGTGGGGGGDFTPTTTAQNVARTASRVDSGGNVKAYGLAKGGLAQMLGE
tara:strand:+ start:699 stop:1868 length:1170 start_codon:yes stop_codon:yes gene_type:complete